MDVTHERQLESGDGRGKLALLDYCQQYRTQVVGSKAVLVPGSYTTYLYIVHHVMIVVVPGTRYMVLTRYRPGTGIRFVF